LSRCKNGGACANALMAFYIAGICFYYKGTIHNSSLGE
jgi:hypothetical protein